MGVPILLQIAAFAIAVIIHEVAHGWTADKLGDPTARLQGRLSLNPLVHIDPYGSILIPLILIIVQSPFIFGWAKPVPFDPYNLKNPRRDSALISIAGPVSNILIAIVSSILLRIMFSTLVISPILALFLANLIGINILLALFNLIPVHPLDGGKIFVGLLPEEQAYDADKFLHRYGTIILLFLIFPFGGQSPLFAVLSPAIEFIVNILIPNAPMI